MTEYAGGKRGFYIKKRPRKYLMTPQQQKLKNTIEECGIKKGITKKELQIRMVECVGPKMRGDDKNQKNNQI